MHIWSQPRNTKKYTEYSVSIAKNKNNNILAFVNCIHTPVRGSITYHRYSSLQPICQKPAARWPVDSSLALLICSHRDALFHKKNRIDAVFFSPSRNSIRALAGICRPITGLKCFCLKKLREGNGCPYHHCCDGMDMRMQSSPLLCFSTSGRTSDYDSILYGCLRFNLICAINALTDYD